MTYDQIVNEARRRALSGTFTDEPDKLQDDVYLVKDINLVIKAFISDIDAGDTKTYDEPADFLDYHGIEWQ